MRYENIDKDGSAPQECDALLLHHTTILIIEGGQTESGEAGDYLLTFPDGRQGIVAAETFHNVYRAKTYQGPAAITVPIKLEYVPAGGTIANGHHFSFVIGGMTKDDAEKHLKAAMRAAAP